MGFGLNWIGAAAGYNAYKEDQRQQATEQALAEQRAFEKAQHEQQEYEWNEARRIRENQKSDAAEFDAKFPSAGSTDGAAPATPTPDPASTAATPALSGGSTPGATTPTASPSDGAVQTYPVADPSSGITPTVKAADLQTVPVDASLAGGPSQPVVADNVAAAVPAAGGTAPAQQPKGADLQSVPVDASLAGAPPQPAVGSSTAAVPQTARTAPAAGQTSPSPATQAPATSPAATPSGDVPGLTAPTGIPRPIKFGNVIDRQRYVLDAAARRGDISPQAYAQARGFIDKLRAEGITQALDAFSRGDFQGGLDAYNNNGIYNGARIDPNRPPQETTTTLPDGSKLPTKLVTIINQDGSRVTIDTTQDRFKMMNLADQLGLMDKGADREVKRITANAQQTHAEAMKQQADTNEKWRQGELDDKKDQRFIQGLAILAKQGGAANAEQAANWTKEADSTLWNTFKSKDPDGNETYDGDGFKFAKQVAMDYSRQNGGDAMSGVGMANGVENRLRQTAAAMVAKDKTLNMPAVMRQLRADYLKHATATQPGQQGGQVPPGAQGPSGINLFDGITPDETDVIQKVAGAANLDPNQMAAVLQLEHSGTDQVSPVGAAGRWQITRANVKAYGGDPRDFKQGALMAARVLQDAKARYPNNPRAQIAYYNGGAAQGDAVAAGKQPPAPETQKYLARYDAMAGALPAQQGAPRMAQTAYAMPQGKPAQTAPTAPPAQKAAQVAGSGMGLSPDDYEDWVKDRLMGWLDGPDKYLEISRTNPNPKIRAAAARLYAKAQGEASNQDAVASNPL